MALFRFAQSVGLLDRAEADAQRRTTQETGQRPIDVLLQRVDGGRLAEQLTAHLGVPLVDLSAAAIQPEALRLLSKELAKRYDAMPIRLDRGRIVIAFANPLDGEGIKAVEFSSRSKVEIVVAPASQIRAAIQQHFYFGDEITNMLASGQGAAVEVVNKNDNEEIAENLLGEGKDKATIIRLVELLLVDGLRLGASDIHIESSSDGVPVRYRINGVLERGVVIPKSLHVQVVARIKVMASLDITERRRPQDGSIHVTYEDRKADVRVSVLPTQFGEKVVLRLLDPTSKGHGLDKIGMTPSEIEMLRRESRRPEGMILISGPTGSGKSTTAHAILQDIADSRLNIVSIENPIEHRLQGISQVEVNEKQGLGFAETLRSILRQDPDVIFVGEIRDAETASIALRAAQTGHLVLSTVHTIDATASITRLLDLGIDPSLISASLRLVIAQRLVRSLCPRCVRPLSPPSELDLARLTRHGKALSAATTAAGCSTCRDTGFTSRIGIFEMLPVSRRLRAMLERQEAETLLRAQARAEGVRSMPAAALVAVNEGRTTVDEVLRVVPPEEWHSEEATNDIAAGKPAAASAADARSSAPQGPFQVLVVEDDAVVQKVIRHALARSPLALEVVTANDAASALQLCDSQAIHLVLLDVGLPDLSGFELCARIRADARLGGVPIFMSTGRGDVDAKAEAFRAGADDYLVKPLDPEELVLRVVRALERNYGARVPATEPMTSAAPAASVVEAAVAREPLVAIELPPLPEPPPAMAIMEEPLLPPALRARATSPEQQPGAALLKGRPAGTEQAEAPKATAAVPRQDAWSKFLGRSRSQ